MCWTLARLLTLLIVYRRHNADTSGCNIGRLSDLMAGKYGVKASTRFGLGILRSNVIAKMTNIKTSL
ncbi:MAG: hypothetical protein ABSB71_01450 [Candidatus Bathyarchaeia archaeon]